MNKFAIIVILCFAGGLFTGLLKAFGLDYAHIACVYLIVIWANILANEIDTDMDR